MSDVLRYSAFSDSGLGGNPASVVLEASSLDEDSMREIAADVGYSETAFVSARPGANRTFDVRYFSPRVEVPFCGHATIAAGVAISERIGDGRLTFSTASGEIIVDTTTDTQGVLATLTSIPPMSRPATPEEVSTTLEILGWGPDELDDQFPPHVANAGNDHLILVAASRRRLARLRYDANDLGNLMTERGWITLQLVFAESHELFHARNPFPVGGVFEDPATGAAAAAFGGYLRVLGYVPTPPRFTILQGEDMGRPSRLEVEVPVTGGIRVTGRAIRIPE